MQADDGAIDDGLPRHDVPRGGRSGFTVVDGRQVHYLEWGHAGAAPVLALHGGGQTAYMYESLGSTIGARYHVLAPDLPSHGDSAALPDPPDGVAPAAAMGPGMIAATIPALLDEFGLARCAVVGASLGGLTGIRLADSHPDRVGALALIDVGHRLEPEGVRKIVDFMAAHESFASLEDAAAAIGVYLPQRRDVRPASLTRNLRQRPDGRWVWKHGFGRRFRELDESEHPADNLEDFLDGISDAAASIRCPALVLRGDASDVLSQQGAEEVAALIPGAELATVEKAGHLAAGDNPHSTTSLISEFLGRHPW